MDDESARSSSLFPAFGAFDPLTRNMQSFSHCPAEMGSIHTSYPQSLQHYVPEYPRTEDYALGSMDSMRNGDYPAYYAQTVGCGQFSSSRMPLQTSYSLQDALQDSSSTQTVSGRRSLVPFQSDTGYAEKDNNPSPSILINSRVSHTTSQFAPYALLPLPNSPHEAPSAMNSEASCMASFEGPAHIDTSSSTIPAKKKKKSKMHQCEICLKEFPRPSGLKTHMNSHNNNKPFHCTFPGCTRTFTVRSNAKRHLRTHGISPEDADSMFPRSSSADFEVNFDEPMVQHQHEFNNAIPPLKWMPPTSLSALVSTESLTAIPEDTDSDWEESKEDPVIERNFGQISIPLRPVLSYGGQDFCEERNSYEEAADPYHASQTSGEPSSRSYVNLLSRNTGPW